MTGSAPRDGLGGFPDLIAGLGARPYIGRFKREPTMLRLVEFEHEGRRYHAEVQPVPDGGPEFKMGAWFVSVGDAEPRRVFEAHAEDADTPAFRHRLMIATLLAEGWERRSGAERRKRARQNAMFDRRSLT